MLDLRVSVPNKGTSDSPIPAWAVEAAASAPRISPADAAPLLAMFAEARAACDAATVRFRERETAPAAAAPRYGCPCGHASDEECIRHRPILDADDWPHYGSTEGLHAGGCTRAGGAACAAAARGRVA